MNMCRVLFYSIVTILISANTNASTTFNCNTISNKLPELEIVDTENSIEHDFSLSYKDLTALTKNKRTDVNSDSKLVLRGGNLGLTSGQYKYTMFIMSDFKRVKAGVDAYCPQIQKIFIRFSYASKIYVAKEYPVGSCKFKHILGHELEHHKVNITNKQKYLKWLLADLKMVASEIAKGHRPVSRKNVNSISEKLKVQLHDAVDAYIYKMQLDTDIQNKKLDTTTEYLKLNRAMKRCDRDAQ